jgi:hypothetical protein
MMLLAFYLGGAAVMIWYCAMGLLNKEYPENVQSWLEMAALILFWPIAVLGWLALAIWTRVFP